MEAAALMTPAGPEADQIPAVLHVVVGHGLATYFLNAVRSVRATSPRDRMLVIDNASPDPALRAELQRVADADELTDVMFRSENDTRQNAKVGSVYAAYEVAFDYAIGRGFDLLHLIQGDFQVLWWDSELVMKSLMIFDSHPQCVNIQMQMYSRDMQLTDDLDPPAADGTARLRKYGLTDTGLYHLRRWQARDMRFGKSEQEHAQRYLSSGLEVVAHPWPTDVPIPWPAVIRNGVQRGREVVTAEPFLIKPLPAGQIAALKAGPGMPWREDFCVPWGWACATPMWATDLNSIDYWVMRYRDAKKNGMRNLFPRFEPRGIPRRRLLTITGRYPRRPSLVQLFIACPARYAIRGLARTAVGSLTALHRWRAYRRHHD
jgi:hypothetical protein